MPRISHGLAAVVLTVPSAAMAAEMQVGEGGTIQGAIDGALDGDVILVAPGVYHEAIDFLGKRITVRADAGPFQTTLDAFGLGTTAVVMDTSPDGGEFEQRLEGFRIKGAAGDGFGGGVFVAGAGEPVIAHCIIENNTATWGGGMFIGDGSGVRVHNTIIFGNSSTGFGSAVFSNQSHPTFSNCTITANSGSAGGGVVFSVASYVLMTNSVVWGNAPRQIMGVNPQIQYSLVEGGWTGMANIDRNPLFKDPEQGDYRPSLLSPCIDAGSNGLVVEGVGLDIRGNDRAIGAHGGDAIVDMGAIEYQGVESGDPLPPVVEAAPPGMTIIVRPGVYEGPIDFDGKPITLMSTGGPESTSIILPDEEQEGPVVLFTSGEGVNSILDGFTIEGATAPRGAGMIIEDSQPVVINCIFRNNFATGGQGGAIAIRNGTPDIINCVFVGNQAGFPGDGEGTFGGGAILNESSAPRITNCTFLNNFSDGNGGAIMSDIASAPFIANCILGVNQPDQISGPVGLVSYSNVEGGYPGPGNIDAEPRIIDEFRLDVFSPCIDAGDATAFSSNLGLDIFGQPRFFDDPDSENTGKGAPIDMGAFEFQGPPPLPPCDEDVTGDGEVGFADILAVLSAYGPCDGCVEDIDRSGDVGFGDILRILSTYGPCPAALGACCTYDGCFETDEISCFQMEAFFLGVGTTCEYDGKGVPCGSGACCLPFEGCVQLDEASCSINDGQFFGVGSDCFDVECAYGACCLLSEDGGDPCLEFYPEIDCEESGGIYQGDGTSCEDAVCEQLDLGACCIYDGTCVDGVDEAYCFGMKGEYLGSGTICEQESCGQ